jgi:plasmid stability protein
MKYEVEGTMVQIRNVPVELHRRLKARAALEGLSMSDFVLREVTRALERPSRAEVIERLRSRPRLKLGDEVVVALREERARYE